MFFRHNLGKYDFIFKNTIFLKLKAKIFGVVNHLDYPIRKVMLYLLILLNIFPFEAQIKLLFFGDDGTKGQFRFSVLSVVVTQGKPQKIELAM